MGSRLTVGKFLFAAACISAAAGAAFGQAYKVEARYKIGGEGGWDYLSVDAGAHRLYIAHSTKVDVIDLGTGKSIGEVTGLTRCHGVVISADGNTGFASDGGANDVVVFDPATFKTLSKIPAGTNPDGMALEPVTNTLWAFNGGSKSATVIDVAGRKAIGTVAVSGRPEFPAADGKGNVFVNIEDKGELQKIDAKSQKVLATWKLAGCESPSGLAIDAAGERLFSVCDGKKMAVTDGNTGKQIASAAIGNGPDAAGYDAKAKVAFSSNGEDGTLTIVDAGKAGYPVRQTLTTMKSARTMTLDPSTGKVYLVYAESGKLEPGQRRAAAVPGSFTVLVVGRE